jgi:hypothetical protein
MSSSNLAVRVQPTATDLLSDPSRPLLRVLTNEVTSEVRSFRTRAPLQSRNIVNRDQGFRLFNHR